jgi:hypothetical protein
MDGNSSEPQSSELASMLNNNEPLLEPSFGSVNESEQTSHQSLVSMPEDRPTDELPADSNTETTSHFDVAEQPGSSLTEKIDDQLKAIEKQQQHNVFEYVNIVAQHAKSASVESGWFENPDGTKGDPFAKLILDVDHDEIVGFIAQYGTNVTLGLPSGHELSATVSLTGNELAKNQIIVELPLSGRAADDFFRDHETNPIVTRAFDEAYAKEAHEKQNQVNGL